MRSRGFRHLALQIARKDWRESRRIVILLTTGLLVPATLVRIGEEGTQDFAMGLLAGMLAGTSFGYAQYCFQNERQRGTLETLLCLPVRPHEVVLAKYLSVYSLVLFTVNVPALLVPRLDLLYMSNAAALFLATVFMASTVVSARPWAFQIPVWSLLLFVLPARQILERYYPAGLRPFQALASHPIWLATAALASIPLIVIVSTTMFSASSARD